MAVILVVFYCELIAELTVWDWTSASNVPFMILRSSSLFRILSDVLEANKLPGAICSAVQAGADVG